MKALVITHDSELAKLVDEINQALWDDANDMVVYDVGSLQAYLQRQDTVFIACHASQAEKSVLMGIASGRIEIKPYANSNWLYIDEVDVCVDQRRKGAGKCIMKKLFEIAEENGCEEVWLGTEVDNVPANALYRSLNPEEDLEFVGYTYKTDV